MTDVRYAWRGLRRSPGFAAVTILTLGLGIGASTAIFSLVKYLLLDELPFRDARQLVFVSSALPTHPRVPLSGPELKDVRERATLFSGFGGIWTNTARLTGEDPQQLRVGRVTRDFFDVLGVSPMLGRTFTVEDEAPSARSVLLSYPLFRSRFGSNPSLIGKTIQINNEPTTVVGVMAPGFRPMLSPDSSVPDDLDAWAPFPATMTQYPRAQRFLRVVGRMKPGVELAQAQQQIEAIGAELGREHRHPTLTMYSVGLHEDAMRDVRPLVLAFFAAVGILLVVAGVNVASLLIARTAARGRELAVRMALGAGTAQLFRQFAIEGILLSVLGGIAGVVIGQVCLTVLFALRPATLDRMDMASIDPAVLVFVLVLVLAWAFLLSLAPLAQTRRANVSSGIQTGDRNFTNRLPYRRRAILVATQLALSVVLLVGAGLLLRGFVQLLRVDAGFSDDNILTFRLAATGERYDSIETQNVFSEELRSRLAALPGITGVGAISHLPYDELPNWGTAYLPEEETDRQNARTADTRAVTPGFFETVGARLIDGRFFTEADDLSAPRVAMVDEGLARRAWPGQSAVGKRFSQGSGTPEGKRVLITVVGVVQHLRHRDPTAELAEQIYFPVRQAARNPMAYVVRSTSDAETLTPQIRELLRGMDPTLPIYDVRTLSAYVSEARGTRRFTMILAIAFAASAVMLAAVGVYGVCAYAVALRRNEFGVRLALGATSPQLMRLVMSESVRLLMAGLLLGIPGAALAARLMRAQLYGVTPADPVSYFVAAPTLALVVALAALLPAWRATRVSPLESLRSE